MLGGWFLVWNMEIDAFRTRNIFFKWSIVKITIEVTFFLIKESLNSHELKIGKENSTHVFTVNDMLIIMTFL